MQAIAQPRSNEVSAGAPQAQGASTMCRCGGGQQRHQRRRERVQVAQSAASATTSSQQPACTCLTAGCPASGQRRAVRWRGQIEQSAEERADLRRKNMRGNQRRGWFVVPLSSQHCKQLVDVLSLSST